MTAALTIPSPVAANLVYHCVTCVDKVCNLACASRNHLFVKTYQTSWKFNASVKTRSKSLTIGTHGHVITAGVEDSAGVESIVETCATSLDSSGQEPYRKGGRGVLGQIHDLDGTAKRP
jgi:hypothetical protein